MMSLFDYMLPFMGRTIEKPFLRIKEKRNTIYIIVFAGGFREKRTIDLVALHGFAGCAKRVLHVI